MGAGPELGSLQKHQVISTAQPSLQPRFLGIKILTKVLPSHPGWPSETKVAQQDFFHLYIRCYLKKANLSH